MISPQKIHELAVREQTTDVNIAREYLQHLFLSYFYKKEDSDKFLFKGGTALRLAFGSPRYSEDLDFSVTNLSKDRIERLLLDTFASLEAEGIQKKMEIIDAEPTSGGYIANISLDILGFTTGIKSNIQIKNDPADLESEAILIENAPFIPSYSMVCLSRRLIVKEKVQALISRYKPRDFFDLYFMSRKDSLKDFIPRDETTKEGIRKVLGEVSDGSLENDLKPFLPISFHAIIKNLKTNIKDIMSL
jgi:predicted nucleotidyltransferase component of viral defense system